MSRHSQLINSINSYSNDSHWTYRLIKFAAGFVNLVNKSENYDIKDEELFNQFESFMSAYKELINSLNVESANLNQDSLEDAAQLIDTLKKRYDRIINNPYLNMSENEGYEEEFNPGEFTKFLEEVAEDAENRLKAVAGDDVDISEMRAAQYANEFNDNKSIDKGDQNITWTGDKVRQNLEARKRWFENLMLLKKLNINDPRYQSYIEMRRRQYQNIMSDPARKSEYRQKANSRSKKYYNSIAIKKEELTKKLQFTTDPKKVKELENELKYIISKEENFKQKNLQRSQEIAKKKETAPNVHPAKAKGEEHSLEALSIHLKQRLASAKTIVKQSKTDIIKAEEHAIFQPYVEQLKVAAENKDANKIKEITVKLQKAIADFGESLPEVQEQKRKNQSFDTFRSMLNQIIRQNILQSELDPNSQTLLKITIEEGNKLLLKYGVDPIYKTTMPIVSLIIGKLSKGIKHE